MKLMLLIAMTVICSYVGIHRSSFGGNTKPPTAQDSVLNKLQIFVDSNYLNLFVYCKLEADKNIRLDQISANANRIHVIQDSLGKIPDIEYSNLCSIAKSSAPGEKLLAIKTAGFRIDRLETEAAKLALENDAHNKFIKTLDTQMELQKKKYDPAKKLLSGLASQLNGAGTLSIHGQNYRFFIVSNTEHNIHIYNSKNGPSSIPALRKESSKTGDPLMITNGGMFMPGYSPQGLLIEDGQIKHELDTVAPNNSNMNFYLLPNGVFFIDNAGKFHIDDTPSFRESFPKEKKHLQFATQSGPLLFNTRRINKNFRPGSDNLNIRSGVGKVDSGRVVFIISDSRVNFFDFAFVFREIFQCSTALYLDGAISQMYISEKLYKKPGGPIDGSFGPLISVTPKKKS